jgi:uncharacterized membrane protein YidH (DUF202 family)
MYIGLGILLLVAGLILDLDVITVNIPHVNAHGLGAILIGAGVLAIVLSLTVTDRYRSSRRVVVDEPPVVEERELR